ncbi:hypothetical protein [Xanthomonas phage L522]|nr:hypothetical protein [Xanthomonas phage L522]
MSNKSTTLKLQLTDGRIIDLKATWDDESLKYRITAKEIPHMIAYTPSLSEAKTYVLRAIWSGGGRC